MVYEVKRWLRKNPDWHPLDWLIIRLLIVFSIYLAIPTSAFFDAKSVAIDGYDVTVTRTFPLHQRMPWLFKQPPIVEYTETVRPVKGRDRPCLETAQFRYRDNGRLSASWNIESWAASCMQGDYIWRAIWHVKLWGVVPLRKDELSEVVIVPKIYTPKQQTIGGGQALEQEGEQ